MGRPPDQVNPQPPIDPPGGPSEFPPGIPIAAIVSHGTGQNRFFRAVTENGCVSARTRGEVIQKHIARMEFRDRNGRARVGKGRV